MDERLDISISAPGKKINIYIWEIYTAALKIDDSLMKRIRITFAFRHLKLNEMLRIWIKNGYNNSK